MEILFLHVFLIILVCFVGVKSDPEFCNLGFDMASKFHDCWLNAMYAHKFQGESQPTYDKKYMEEYATHMCSVVKPVALACLREDIHECSNIEKLMAIADDSGGACLGDKVNPFFKKYVINRLKPIEADPAQCFEVRGKTMDCYQSAGQTVMQAGSEADDVAFFYRVADKFFDAFWQCTVKLFKSNKDVCPNWQLPMLLTLQDTAMPSLFGLRLRPEQVAQLELGPMGEGTNKTEGGDRVVNIGPSKLYLLVQLYKTKPDIKDQENSMILEVSDLNVEPRLVPEQGEEGVSPQQAVNPNSLSMWELKKLLRVQRKRYYDVRDFIRKAKERQENTQSDEEGMLD